MALMTFSKSLRLVGHDPMKRSAVIHFQVFVRRYVAHFRHSGQRSREAS